MITYEEVLARSRTEGPPCDPPPDSASAKYPALTAACGRGKTRDGAGWSAEKSAVTPGSHENTWIIINEGGGPTDDKPDVTLQVREDANRVDMFMNFRVADIQASYAEWQGKGAEFLTEPKEHEREWRCYMKDPDGYIIEVGQAKM